MPMSKVDIVIASFNQPGQLLRCVEDIRAHTKYPHRIFIADDHSDHPEMPDTLALLEKEQTNLRIIAPASHRLGFAGNNNRAVSFTSAPNILLLNQDCYMQQGFLEEMVRWVNPRRRIGIVGAKLIFPVEKGQSAGRIQHIGVARYQDGAPYHPHRDADPRIPAAQAYRWVNAVTGACMLVTRDLWDALNGFDEVFSMGQFEDVDFCFRARYLLGTRILLTPRAVGLHFEHGAGEKYVLEAHDRNRALLLKRWGYLGGDEYEFDVSARTEAEVLAGV